MQTDFYKTRRDFLGKIGASIAIPTLLSSLDANAAPNLKLAGDADEWFKKVKGKHKIVYDGSEPNGGFPIIWSWVFLNTNNSTGTPDNELGVVVVLRHGAIPLAMDDKLWAKYKFGEAFKINDSVTKAPAVKNIYNVPSEPMWTSFGINGIQQLTARGVMFCVCDMALTVNSMMMAEGMKMKPEDIKQEWVSGLLPGVQVVPSGVWAVGRAQEQGCAYCYAGG